MHSQHNLCIELQKREKADKALEESEKKKANFSQGKMFGVSRIHVET
jgi:hypothetical protein